MLQIKNLSITHKKDLRPLLDHFTFSLNSGDKAVIISEEGNGKSTLLKLIYDSRLVDSYVEYTGDILTQGTLMGYLPQEFPPEYKEQTIYTYCTSIPAFQTGIRENWPLSPPGFGFPRIFFTPTSCAAHFREVKK